MLKDTLNDEIWKAFRVKNVYTIINNKVMRVRIVHVNWFNNVVVVKGANGSLYYLNPYDYKITWSIYKNDIFERRSNDVVFKKNGRKSRRSNRPSKKRYV